MRHRRRGRQGPSEIRRSGRTHVYGTGRSSQRETAFNTTTVAYQVWTCIRGARLAHFLARRGRTSQGDERTV